MYMVYLFIVSFYRQLSADIKIKIDKIKANFVSPKGLKEKILKLCMKKDPVYILMINIQFQYSFNPKSQFQF